jgi:hypothetical protein
MLSSTRHKALPKYGFSVEFSAFLGLSKASLDLLKAFQKCTYKRVCQNVKHSSSSSWEVA